MGLRCENGSWFDHVLEWYEASKADPEHVMFLRYEDMLANPAAHIKKIADFVDIETTPEIIEKVSYVHARASERPQRDPAPGVGEGRG